MPSGFTQAGVESLAKMKQLKYMHVKLQDIRSYYDEDSFLLYGMLLAMLTLIAGRVPNLIIADFDFENLKSWLFIMKYGELFPDKNLMIRQVE